LCCHPDIASKLAEEVKNLQSQINLLTEMDKTFAQNQTIESDKIICKTQLIEFNRQIN